MKLASAARGFGFLAAFGVAAASAPAGAEVIDGEFTFGGRAINGDTHSGKFEEYRDLRPGLFGGGNFLIESPNGRTFLWGDFDKIGYDDQSYQIEVGEWGRFRLFGEYAELPHTFSTQSRTLYNYSGSNLLLLPDAFQQAVQDAGDTTLGGSRALQSATLGAGLSDARRTSLDYRLRTIVGGLVFDPREDLQFETAYRSLDRSGRRPFNMGFGSPGGNFTSFASPKEERTDEVTADVRWGRGPLNLEAGYLGSFFDNHLNQVTVDNPIRAVDSATAGAAQGRISQAPDNSLNQFHLSGTYDLPVEMPARLATTFAYGLREQDDDFIPHTINSAIDIPANAALLALPRDGLDGKVQTYLANVLFTARPLPDLDLRARYRFYDYHNDTPVLSFPGHVVNDATLDDEIVRSVPNDYDRQQASLDASYRFSRMVKVTAGPFWDQWSRSRDREVSRLDEWGAKISTDVRPARWALIRADYLFGTRNGSGYNPFDYLKATLDPEQVEDPDFVPSGQLEDLRKFDEADRTRNEVKFLTQLMPREDLDFSFSGGWAKYDYRNSDYGVKGDQRWNVGAEIGYQPVEWLSVSTWYSFERMWLDQRSRYRGATGDDPADDWSSEQTDTIHTIGAQLGFVLIPEKLDLDFAYVFERGNGETHSHAAPGGSASGEAPNYPDIEDRLQLFTTTLRYHWNENLSLEGVYAFEKLSLADFRVDGLNPYMPGSDPSGSRDVFLGNRLGDYAAHIFALSATYRF